MFINTFQSIEIREKPLEINLRLVKNDVNAAICNDRNIIQGFIKMFPPKTKADGMVQCVSEGHGKSPGRNAVETRRAGPRKTVQVINIH